jgi:hypothetical protein
MINDNNITEEQIFSQKDTSDIISEILKKYGLDENEEEVFEKLQKAEPLRGEIILNLAIQITQKKIPPKELAPLLQKQLAISKKTAEDLSQDIEIKLFDLVKESLERKPLVVESHVPTKIEPLQAFFEKQPIEEPFITKRPTPQPAEEESRLAKPSPKPKISEKIKKTPKKPDVYREPTE